MEQLHQELAQVRRELNKLTDYKLRVPAAEKQKLLDKKQQLEFAIGGYNGFELANNY